MVCLNLVWTCFWRSAEAHTCHDGVFWCCRSRRWDEVVLMFPYAVAHSSFSVIVLRFPFAWRWRDWSLILLLVSAVSSLDQIVSSYHHVSYSMSSFFSWRTRVPFGIEFPFCYQQSGFSTMSCACLFGVDRTILCGSIFIIHEIVSPRQLDHSDMVWLIYMIHHEQTTMWNEKDVGFHQPT